MINSMYKHMNHLSRPVVQALEKAEHGLSKTPSNNELIAIESEEHGKKMTMSKLLRVESKEHAKKYDDEDEEDDDEEDDDVPDQSASAPHHNSMGPMVVKARKR
jgi:hypothetical protein